MPNETTAWDQLSSQTAQVLICDLQKQLVARSKTTEPKALQKSASVLMQLAKLFSLPTTLSVVPEQERPPELIQELQNSGAQEKLRLPVSPFLDEPTVQTLASAKRKVLIIAGFATEAVVLHAALDALKQGYQVLVPVDACGGGISEATEAAAFRQIEAAGAITTSVVSIATKLSPDFTTDQGKQMFAIIQQLRLA